MTDQASTTPLKAVRLRRGLTMRQVATSVGTDMGNMSRIEAGKSRPSPDLAQRIAAFFGGELNELQLIYPERFSQASFPQPKLTGRART